MYFLFSNILYWLENRQNIFISKIVKTEYFKYHLNDFTK